MGELRVETDKLTHLYSLHVKSDNTFEVFIDQESIRTGNLEDEWDFLLPKEIKDPAISKPDDWDDEEDGEWESPTIDNPDYKGPWKPKMIDNPEYKGEWEHPMIPNPDYKEDKDLHVRCKECTHVGFELWQVKSGTLFDDIIVTDSLQEAKDYADQTFNKKKGPEKEMFDAAEAKRKEEEEAARAAAKDDEDDEDDEDEEDDEHDEL